MIKDSIRNMVISKMSKYYYVDKSWIKSYLGKKPVDALGKPIPWNSYAFIDFIEPRLKRNFRIFEYGSGNSTLWYAERVENVIAVENDKQWFLHINAILPNNAMIIYRDLDDSYIEEIANYGYFDIIVIDGLRRNECAMFSLRALKTSGIIVWDDSERKSYQEGIELLKTTYGFKEISFYGLKPGSNLPTKTSVLYRENNCLEI